MSDLTDDIYDETYNHISEGAVEKHQHANNIDPFDWIIIASLIEFNPPDTIWSEQYALIPYSLGGRPYDITCSQKLDMKIYRFSEWLGFPNSSDSFLHVDTDSLTTVTIEVDEAGDWSWFPLNCSYRFHIKPCIHDMTDNEEWGSLQDIHDEAMKYLNRDKLVGDASYAIYRIEEMQVEECIEFARIVFSTFSLPFSCADALQNLVKEALVDFSPAKIFYFIDKSIKDAHAYYTQTRVPSKQAANSIIKKMESLIHRARNEGWDVANYARRKEGRDQSILAKLISHHLLKLSGDIIYYSMSDIEAAVYQRYSSDKLFCPNCKGVLFDIEFMWGPSKDGSDKITKGVGIRCRKCTQYIGDIEALNIHAENLEGVMEQIGDAEMTLLRGRDKLK